MAERKPELEQNPHPEPRFPLGQTLATPGALEALKQADQEAIDLLVRPQSGD